MTESTYTRSFYFPHDTLDTSENGTILNPLTGEYETPPSMTKQSFVDECDINKILNGYRPHEIMAHLQTMAAGGQFLDLSDPLDYQESMNIVAQADQTFANLPSKVRNRFHNSPAEFLEFMGDPSNQDEAIKLGLATDNRPPANPPPEPPKGPETPPTA